MSRKDCVSRALLFLSLSLSFRSCSILLSPSPDWIGGGRGAWQAVGVLAREQGGGILDRTARDDETRMPSCQTHSSSFRGGCRGVVARVYSRRRRLYWPQKQGWAEWSSALTLSEEWAWEWEWQGDVARSG